MTKYVKFNGQTHAFPDEASESDIMNALSPIKPQIAQQLPQKSEQGPKIDPSQLPGSGISNFLMGSLQNSGSTKDILMSRLLAAKQGALDLGQGAKQLGLSALERMGSVPQGTTQNYTGNTDLQRLQYAQSPGSQDMVSKFIRSGISNSPYLALGPGGDAKLAAKLLRGAAGGAGIGAASYTGQDESRLANALGGAVTGAAVPAIGMVGSKLKSVLSDIPGSIDSINKLNPMNLTSKNIAKNIIETRNKNISKYTDLYGNLFNDAKKNDVYNSNALKQASRDINFPILDRYTPSKKLASVNDFVNNPNLETAHMAKSDLQKIVENLDRETSLMGWQKKQQEAAKDAISKIDGSMFKDDFGDINQNLSDKYKEISAGYKKEVVPYKDNNIIKFRKKEISPGELVQALSKGKFMAQRGEQHPELGMRKLALPYATGALGTVGLAELAKYLYNKSP